MRIFEHLKYQQVRTCIDVLNETKAKNLEFISSKYESASENFDGVKHFLKELGFLSEKNDILSMSQILETADNRRWADDELKGLLRKALLETRGPLSNRIQAYLYNFKVAGNAYVYKPPTASRLKESGIRNFFMELDLVEHSPGLGAYKIKEKHLDLFEAYLKRKTFSPKELALILKKKDELGRAAELEVLRYERQRLARQPELLAKIEHTALNDVMAGYDILSWETERQEGRPVPRYIEVKAVSRTDSKFYWSRHEIEKAKELTKQYSLYLLPVVEGNSFDASNLEIISDPITHIFHNPKNWNYQVETYLFSKT